MNLILIAAMSVFATFAQAEIISSKVAQVNPASIAEFHPFYEEGVRVSVTVEHDGGATDMTPTSRAYLAVTRHGEDMSRDATFNLGSIYYLESVRQLKAGFYEIKVKIAGEGSYPEMHTLTIDLRKTLSDIMKYQTPEDFVYTAKMTKKKSEGL